MKTKYSDLTSEQQDAIDGLLNEQSSMPDRFYSFDDTGNAHRFTDNYGEIFRYNHADKAWLYWDKTRWKYDDDGAVFRAVNASVESMKNELEYYRSNGEKDAEDAFSKHMKYSRSHKGKTACESECRPILPVTPGQLDQHKMAFNTPSGVLSLKSGKLTAHDPNWFITKLSPVEYAETPHSCPVWERFLDEVFRGDKELIRYIQKAVGYSLTGRTSEQCAFFLYGTGRNGKSTFLDVISDICGDYAVNIQPETLMIKPNSNGASSDIARLRGARFVTSTEPNEGMRINEGLLKQLTGEDIVTARKLYGNEFEFRPEFKLWMATNHKPIIRGTDLGIWRRVHMIPFSATIPESRVDKQLGEKLRAEYPAILRWAVEGSLMWQREGLDMPGAVRAAVAEYRREMDVVSAFIEDRCEVRDGAYVKASTLFAAYVEWAEKFNEHKFSNTKFGAEVAKRFKKVARTGGNYYIGISLLC
ncbi:MAG: hypothetical protein K2N56_05150 [Oscillospiraceae bacterium]|nr:hypothetical protein [Oscillospiraceae bacterium]